MKPPDPPKDTEELLSRAQALVGRSIEDLARALGAPVAGDARRTKGKVGVLLEQALGATGGSAAKHDFPNLGVELKTIPIDERGLARESTYVCTIAVADPDATTWDTSWVRAKLGAVLWMPILTPRGPGERTIGVPLLWRPTPAQESVLRSDFDEVMGLIGIGGIEGLTARVGRWLQARPKARSGSSRTLAWTSDGDPIEVVPRGFYLRPHVTSAWLRDPSALPD